MTLPRSSLIVYSILTVAPGLTVATGSAAGSFGAGASVAAGGTGAAASFEGVARSAEGVGPSPDGGAGVWARTRLVVTRTLAVTRTSRNAPLCRFIAVGLLGDVGQEHPVVRGI